MTFSVFQFGLVYKLIQQDVFLHFAKMLFLDQALDRPEGCVDCFGDNCQSKIES